MRVAVLDDYQGLAAQFAHWQRLKPQAEVTFIHEPQAEQQALIELLQPFEVVCLMRERTDFPKAVIEALPKLQLIVTTGMKNAAIDLAAAKTKGILVSGTQSPGHATAELTMALMLALARRLVPQVDALRQGRWHDGIGRDLKEAQLGLIGLGRLGAQVALMGQVFGMRVSAWSENLDDARALELGVQKLTKDELLKSSDFISIHQRLSERTLDLIGERELGLMKKTAYLINTSRAPIVKQSALLEALQAGQIAGAASDVYETEPLAADDPWRQAPNFLGTPHIGYVTAETYEIFYQQTVEAIEAWLAGNPVRVIEG